MTHDNEALNGHDLPDAPRPANTRLVDARLHLLDRQIVDSDGEPVGIVDDLEIGDIRPGSKTSPAITAILTGRVLFTRIFGGNQPRTQWHYLPWELVDRVGISVHLRPGADTRGGRWVEQWLRDRIISRIPGGRHAVE